MKSKTKIGNEFLSLITRYGLLVITALYNLNIFFILFTPLTIYPTLFLLGLFYGVSLNGSIIIVEGILNIEMIRACIAGSAYYLLFILNLSVPNIEIKKRVKMIVFSFGFFLFANILRIFLLSIMAISGSNYFDITHQFFWYFLSTAFVIGIWFTEVKIFKIKEIPIYNDIKFLYRSSVLKKQIDK